MGIHLHSPHHSFHTFLNVLNNNFLVSPTVSIYKPDGMFFHAKSGMIDNASFLSSENTKDSYREEQTLTIPVIQEFVSIDKKKEETASVTVTKKVAEQTEVVNVALQSEGYDIEHVARGEYVDESNIPTTRQEGDTLILPVLKEVLVKKIVLVEEVRITKKIQHASQAQPVTLRIESVDIIRSSSRTKRQE